MNRAERDRAVEAMLKTIREDQKEVMECFEKAYETKNDDLFIQLSKRLDSLGILQAALRKYVISMAGFQSIKLNMDMGR